jgi:heat shock protein HtpX
MPLTFIEIERQKSCRISLLFIFLMFMYFCVTYSLFIGFKLIFSFSFLTDGFFSSVFNPIYILPIFAFSLIIAGIHFWFSAGNAVSFVVSNLGAAPPDTEDGVHRTLKDVMEEIHIVTGNKKKITCMVIPSLSMNALAVADLKGESVIAITEGLLSRLKRPQLEAVVAHEAYHILSGDCLETTVAASMFGMYASAIEKLESFRDEDMPGFHPAFLIFRLLVRLSDLLNMFISREREYRADAASVRMTRNPVAMAEALYLLSRNWTGVGLIGSGIEMLCLIKPGPHSSDESEGWWADLTSTHPPIRKRIKILLEMAHKSISSFEAAQMNEAVNSRGTEQYYALDPDQQWQGPYNFGELAFLPWLSPVTWVISGLDKTPVKVSENATINSIFSMVSDKSAKLSNEFLCPVCKHPLVETEYERTKILRCSFCGGTLVENNKVSRIIARNDGECNERIESIARAVLRDNQRKITLKKLKGKTSGAGPLHHCSKCRNPMFRTFYSLAYLIEIDRCGKCEVTWFDADELKMLQCIIENKITAAIDI